MFIQAVVVYDRIFSVFRSKIIAGFDLCWDYRIQWWWIRIRARIKEKLKVRTKYTLPIYSLEIAPISSQINPEDDPFWCLSSQKSYHQSVILSVILVLDQTCQPNLHSVFSRRTNFIRTSSLRFSKILRTIYTLESPYFCICSDRIYRFKFRKLT